MAVAKRIPEPLREVVIFVLAYVVYFGVRVITEGSPAAAMRHALDVIRFEQRLGIDWERPVQKQILGSRLLTDAANAVYMYGHWPVIIVTGALLYRYRRSRYYQLRNVCLLSGLVGLVIFALYPVAPPRLTDLPLVDTVTEHADGYRQLVPRSLVNQYAALPSFHAGWNVLLGIVVFRATRSRPLRALAVIGPATMVVAVVATANHYVIDVAAGVAIVLAGLLALHLIEHTRSGPTPGGSPGRPVPAVHRANSREGRPRGLDLPAAVRPADLAEPLYERPVGGPAPGLRGRDLVVDRHRHSLSARSRIPAVPMTHIRGDYGISSRAGRDSPRRQAAPSRVRWRPQRAWIEEDRGRAKDGVLEITIPLPAEAPSEPVTTTLTAAKSAAGPLRARQDVVARRGARAAAN